MLYSAAVIHRAGDGVATRMWRNTYEFDAGALAVWNASDALAVAEALANMHVGLLSSGFFLDRVVVGAYAPETIISEDQFVVHLDGRQGARTLGANQLLGLETALVVKRQTSQGRPGQLWLRGILEEQHVLGTTGGALILTPGNTLQGDIDALYSTLLGELALVGWDPVIARGTEPTANIRPVTGLVVAGARNRNLRRRVRVGPGLPEQLQTIVDTLAPLGAVAGMLNPIIEAYNALPLADLPLLPD